MSREYAKASIRSGMQFLDERMPDWKGQLRGRVNFSQHATTPLGILVGYPGGLEEWGLTYIDAANYALVLPSEGDAALYNEVWENFIPGILAAA
ncbi:MAG: hypothetical protein RIQ56_759 [Candidatus Parcubacteria bacterium]|jgi:hypothetical protein